MTNLQDFFYDKTVNWISKPIKNMFLYSHLVAIVDPEVFNVNADPQRGDTSVQRTLMSQRIDVINHPGDIIGIVGFFLNNTELGMMAMLTGLQDKSVKLYTNPCQVVSPVFITCKLPLRF
jgi:hypothetical protein